MKKYVVIVTGSPDDPYSIGTKAEEDPEGEFYMAEDVDKLLKQLYAMSNGQRLFGQILQGIREILREHVK